MPRHDGPTLRTRRLTELLDLDPGVEAVPTAPLRSVVVVLWSIVDDGAQPRLAQRLATENDETAWL